MQDPIAIVGLGCRFPRGANSPRQFWELICQKYDAITEVPEDRWNLDHFYDGDDSEAGTIRTKCAGFIDNFDKFDAGFFGISPREANAMDPQQRQLLQVTWEMFEDAGEIPEQLKGSRTGVYVGCFAVDYNLLSHDVMQRDLLNAHTSIGASATLLSNRISHYYDFQGPSLSVDTACSSSMVALHLACQALCAGDIDRAVVGGVNMIFKPEWTISTSKGGFLSPDGRCKVFDASANGYVRSEGVGAFLLKPLSLAQKDGNRIYGVIRQTGSNQDGHTKSVTVPSRPSQARLMGEVYKKAGIDPCDIAYVEAHGTGTPTGDPIETGALADIFGQARPKGSPCLIGSVKSNIGHLEAASGMAGLMKAVLSLYHRQIPPNIHLNAPNPNIPFDDWNLKAVTEITPLESDGAPRYVGVNSFGFGGSNVHVVLEGADRYNATSSQPKTVLTEQPLPIFLSARSPESLLKKAEHLNLFIKNHPETPLNHIASQLGLRRQHHDYRLALSAETTSELAAKLEQLTEQTFSPDISAEKTGKTAFVFSGMGPQWWAMGRDLITKEPVFADKIREIDAHLAAFKDYSIFEELTRVEEDSRIEETRIAQPAIFALQVALSHLLASKGILPEAIVGHSAGEVAAAHISGALSLKEACRVIYHRSRLQHTTEGQGRILAVGLSAKDALPYLAGRENDVSLGAINSPHSIALAGDEAVLNDIVHELKAAKVFCKMLNGKVPYHSPKMDPLKDDLITSLVDLKAQASSIPLYSTVSGKISAGKDIDGHYWFHNVREPVLFADAIMQMMEDGFTNFIEISPNPVLANSIEECRHSLAIKGATLTTLKRKQDDHLSLAHFYGRLFETRLLDQWDHIFTPDTPFIDLPHYPWQLERYWLESEESLNYRKGGTRATHLGGESEHPLLGNRLPLASPIWENAITPKKLSYLFDHKVGTDAVYPAAAYIESALGAANLCELNHENGIALADLRFERAFYLTGGAPNTVQFTLSPETKQFNITSQIGNGVWHQHASGRITSSPYHCATEANIPNIFAKETPKTRESKSLYQSFSERGLNYTGLFQAIKSTQLDQKHAVSEIVIDQNKMEDGYMLHPALLDAAFQTFLTLLDEHGLSGLYLPVKLERLHIFAFAPSKLTCLCHLEYCNEQEVRGDITLLDENAHVICEIKGFVCQALGIQDNKALNLHKDDLYAYRWEEVEATSSTTAQSTLENWVIYCHPNQNDRVSVFANAIKETGVNAHILNDLGALEGTDIQNWGLIFTQADEGETNKAPDCNDNSLRLLDCLHQLTTIGKLPKRATIITIGTRELSLAAMPLSGMARVVTNEFPNITCKQIDLDKLEDLPFALPYLEEDKLGSEIAFAGEKLLVNRLHQISPESLEIRQNKATSAQEFSQEAAAYLLERHLPHNQQVTILVHDDGTGIGEAFLQEAVIRNLRVILLAYDKANIAKWQENGANLVLDAHMPELDNRIKDLTGNKGVDLVAYSHEGDDTLRNIGFCAPFGHFIDLSQQPQIFGAWQAISQKHLSYSKVSAQNLYNQNPNLFPKGSKASNTQTPPSIIKPDGCYLITGGVRGFGLRVAQWLVKQGATRLLLLGRSQTLPTESQQAINDLRDQGIQIDVAGVDVCNQAALGDVLSPFTSGQEQLSGIIHAANIYRDAYLNQMNRDGFATVFNTKAIGAWNLHECTKDLPLDFFIMFSSISAVIGNPGQANYVAGNAYLSALSALRNQENRPSLCINWGAIGEVGYLAQNEAVEAQLKQTGISPLSPDSALDAMGELITKEISEITLAHVDWSVWQSNIATHAKVLFSPVVRSDPSKGDKATTSSNLLDQLLASPSGQRKDIMVAQLSELVSAILGLSTDRKPAPHQGFSDLGMDSMLSVEFRNRLQTFYNCTLPATLVFLYPDIDSLCDFLLQDALSAHWMAEPIPDTDQGEDLSLDDLADMLESTLAS